jgi:hypothetical protein
MAFQFTCPQGHWLEADESHAGQQCRCPECGAMFLIPAPSVAAYGGAGEPSSGMPDLLGHGGGGSVGDEPRILHIPCPNGHELETPDDMIGQDVLCPHCGVQFQLRESDSVESKRRRSAEMERIRQRQASLWLNWAIVIAVMVVLGIVGMIAMLFQS